MENQIKKFFVPVANYARSKVFPIWATNKGNITTSFTNEQISAMLKNPLLNYSQLQKVSNYLFNVSSAYQNIAYYMATIMSFDWIISPLDLTQKQTTMWNRFEKSAKKIHMSAPKNIFPMMLLRTIVNGETYWYDLSDGENTIFKEIPSNLCQLAMIDDDNLWRYYVDLSLIRMDELYELPMEIQIAHKRWADGGKSKKKSTKLIDGMELELPDNLHLVSKAGFCMHIHMTNNQHDYPLFVHMFLDFNELENNKSLFTEIIKNQYIKLIHMKVPTDAEGAPLMEESDVRAYHESSKAFLPQNVAPLTNPFEVEAINLDSAQSSTINLVEHNQKVVQTDSGISDTIFNAATTNGLSYSVTADAVKMYPLLYFFNNLMNYKLKEEKFTCTFLELNYYNREEAHKQATTDLASGGSRFMFMATSLMDIYQYIQTVKLEQLLDIDSLLVVKMNGNQMSASSDTGRPELPANNKSDGTITSDNYK